MNGDLDASLAKMRGAMIGARNFDAAVFLGGMEGVEIEYDIFRRLHPTSRLTRSPLPEPRDGFF